MFVDVSTGDDRADVERRAVTIGIVDTDMVQVVDGLTAGERVLASDRPNASGW